MSLEAKVVSSKSHCLLKLGFQAISVFLASFILTIYWYRESWSGFWRNEIPAAGDGLLNLHLLQQIIDSSWGNFLLGNLSSDSFGWPGSANYAYFPLGNLLDMTIIKVFGQIFTDFNTNQIFHTFVVIRIPIIAVITFLCSSLFLKSNLLRVAISLTFTFTPFTLVRSEGHFVLGSTWSIPLFFAAIAIMQKYSNKRRVLGSYLLLLCVGLNNFYFAVFALIILTVIMLISIPRSSTLNQNGEHEPILYAFQARTLRYLGGLVSLSTGLTLQLLPIVFKQRNLDYYYKLSDRSWVEGYIYGGSFESLFSDLVRLVIDLIDRPDILAFFNTTFSWEASHIGLIPGIFLIFLLIVAALHYLFIKPSFFNRLEHIEKILFVSLIVSLFLYMIIWFSRGTWDASFFAQSNKLQNEEKLIFKKQKGK